MKIKDIILSRDILAALAVAGVTFILLPSRITHALARDLYSVGISVLSIVFSVYFAALAIIISSSDNDFVEFLEETDDYSGLIETFRFSLLVLFVALIFSITMYILSSIWIADNYIDQPSLITVVFCFLFLYGMFAAATATLDAIKYSKFRAKFLKLRKKR